MREGLLRCDISTHVTNYFMNSTPNAIKKFTTSSEKLAGIALWHLQMDIFVTPGKDKTMVEFIPRYYEILAKEKGAKKCSSQTESSKKMP